MMKEGKMKGGDKNKFVFVFLLLLLIALIVFGYFAGFFGKITTLSTANVGLNISIGAFYVLEVQNGTASLSLTASTSTVKYFNFTVYSGAGVQFVNDSSIVANGTLIGGPNEVTRNATCVRWNQSTNYATYNCSIPMFWYDGSGNWNLSITLLDNNSNGASNSSTTYGISATTGFTISPVNLTWSALAPGSKNQTATNDPLNLTNTGNQPIGNTTSNVSINSTDLGRNK